MKICMVNSLYPPYRVGGAEVSVQLSAKEVLAAGHDVAVVSLQPDPRSYSLTNQDGVRVHRLGLRNLYWPFGRENEGRIAHGGALLGKPLWHTFDSYNRTMARRVGEVLDAERPDVLHTNNLAGVSVAAWRAAAEAGIAVVHTIRDYYLMCPNSGMFRSDTGANCETHCTACRVFSLPRLDASAAVDGVVGISAFVLETHLSAGYFPRAREYLVSRPRVDLPPPGRTAQDRPPRPAGAPVRIGFLGRIEPQKGIAPLLEAFTGLSPGRAELLVAGAGDDDYVAGLRARYSHPGIRYVGFVPAAELYGGVDVVVVPSVWQEPLGRVALEGAAHGLPVIASRTGGLQEVVDDGRTGLLVPPGDVPALRRALEELVGDPERRDRLGRAGAEAVRAGASGGADALVPFYERLLRSRRRLPAGGPVGG